MRYLDFTYPSAAENLACDEALLDLCDQGGLAGGALRVWEPATHFVVLGYGGALRAEVDEAACRRRGVPIFRRCSGGGSVLQGPGCLNYALIMPHNSQGPWSSLSGTTRYCMERHRAMLEQALGQPVTVQGVSDLTIGGRKISGNAQRRRGQAVLFHGTFLWRFDIARMAPLLRPPARQPAYRRRRAHAAFLVNVPLPLEALKSGLRACWQAREPLEGALPAAEIRALVAARYAAHAWTHRA